MKLTIQREIVLSALELCAAAIKTRPIKPSLAGVLLTATDSLVVQATDLEMSVIAEVGEVQVETRGSALVPAERLRDVVAKLTTDTVTLSTENGNHLHIRTEDDHFKLLSFNANDYPPEPAMEDAVEFTISAPTLKAALDSVYFASAKVAIKYGVEGVCFDGKKGEEKLSMVATDSRKLALMEMKLAEPLPADVNAVVPNKAVAVLGKLEYDDDDIVTVRLSHNRIAFSLSGIAVGTVLLEQKFPPYRSWVLSGKERDKTFTVGTEAFLAAAEKAGLLTNEETRGVKLSFGRKGLVLSSRSPMAGESTVQLAAKYDGEDLVIGFDARNLVQSLRAVASEEVTMKMSKPNETSLLLSGDWTAALTPIEAK